MHQGKLMTHKDIFMAHEQVDNRDSLKYTESRKKQHNLASKSITQKNHHIDKNS
jgi:hypothetical protein